MSQNKIPTNLPSVEKLISRLKSAEQSQQRELRITIQEARDLVMELALLTSKLGNVLQEINESINSLKSSEKIDIRLDGGGFGQDK